MQIRHVQILAVTWLVITTVLGVLLRKSPGEILALGMSGVAIVLLVYGLRRRALGRSYREEDCPELEERLWSICVAMGRRDLSPVVIRHAGMPFLDLREGRLVVSHRLGQMMSDEELCALLVHRDALLSGVEWRSYVRYYSPWIGSVLVFGLATMQYHKPYLILVFFVAVAWAIALTFIPWLHKWAVGPEISAFIEAGGNADALGSALTKLHQEGATYYQQQHAIYEARLIGQLNLLRELTNRPSLAHGQWFWISEGAILTLVLGLSELLLRAVR